MKVFKIEGHHEDCHGWLTEPIVAVYVANNAEEAVARYKAEQAMIVRRVTPMGRAKTQVAQGHRIS